LETYISQVMIFGTAFIKQINERISSLIIAHANNSLRF